MTLADISERVKTEQELLEKEKRLVESAAENARLYALTEKRLQFLSSLRIIDTTKQVTISPCSSDRMRAS